MLATERNYVAKSHYLTIGHATPRARPADAVVLASISGAPLFVSSDLFNQAEVKAQAPMDEKETEKFKEFLKDLKPSDFAKYIGKEPEQDSN